LHDVTSQRLCERFNPQLLYWKPEARDGDHQVIICAPGKLDRTALPPESQGIATLTPITF
jgi:hypothetical protein